MAARKAARKIEEKELRTKKVLICMTPSQAAAYKAAADAEERSLSSLIRFLLDQHCGRQPR